jgi:long-chain fatty acid transport protein
MKKHLIIGVLVLCCASMASAAIVTNFNQSALYLRLLSRNASTDIDAVYYNPAGLTQLKDGFHIALHNQTITQEKTTINNFIVLNNSKYVGDVNVPFYPNFYAVYKKGALAFSFGFGPNAGGGSADYSKGLPSFEYQIAELPAMLSSGGLTTAKYSADIYFKGESIYYGFQANVSYAFNDMFSAAAGLRYIYAVNTYEGHIKTIQINPVNPLLGWTGQMISAPTVFTTLAGLYPPGHPNNLYYLSLAVATGDKAVDAEQTGSGFTPILSLNVHPVEGLNISAKYEFNTKLELTNKTTKDDTGMFPDGVKTNNDIPAILSLGVEYALMPQLRAHFSYNLTFDKNANWDGREKFVDSNSYDYAIGIEYDLTKAISVSAGYLRTKYGLSADYQEDSSFELSSHAFAFGGRIRLGDKLDIDLGGMLVNYQDFSKTISYGVFGSYPEKYQQATSGFSIGLGYHF